MSTLAGSDDNGTFILQNTGKLSFQMAITKLNMAEQGLNYHSALPPAVMVPVCCLSLPALMLLLVWILTTQIDAQW